MKTISFPLARGVGAAAVLATCTLAALPQTSHADRGDSRRRDDRGPPAAAPSRAPAPQARPAPPIPQVRPAPAPRAAVPSIPRPAAPAVTRTPSVPRPSVPTFRPSVPSAVTQGRPSGGDSNGQRFRDRGDFRPPVPSAPVVTERPRDTRLPEVVRRPSVPTPTVVDRSRDDRDGRYPDGFRRGTTGTYSPSGAFNNGRQQQVGGPTVSPAYVRDHRRFSDASRFSHIDRSYAYQSYPHNHYRLCYGNGFRGLGWYFGPPGFSYFYDYPGVTYYASRQYIPSTYLSLTYSPNSSLDYSVQQALYDRGYYDGPIDGDIGPMSRLAIANFQADNGLEPTGIIDENLLRYLQLD